MFFIRNKYGNDGYTVWFMLLEELGKADYHYLDLSDDLQRMYLSSEFKVTEDILISIIETLIKLGEFNRELWEEGRILFNQQFVTSVEDAYRKRTSVCITLPALRQLLSDKRQHESNNYRKNEPNGQEIGDRSTQTKLKESKLKETIENDIPIGISSDGPATPSPSKPGPVSYAERCRLFIKKFNEIRGTKFQVTGSVTTHLKPRLEQYTPAQILNALKRAMQDEFHKENSYKYLTPEYILRAVQIEKYLNMPLEADQKDEPVTQQGTVFINHQNREA